MLNISGKFDETRLIPLTSKIILFVTVTHSKMAAPTMASKFIKNKAFDNFYPKGLKCAETKFQGAVEFCGSFEFTEAWGMVIGSHFLWPVGCVMNRAEYGHIDEYRSGVLSSILSLV